MTRQILEALVLMTTALVASTPAGGCPDSLADSLRTYVEEISSDSYRREELLKVLPARIAQLEACANSSNDSSSAERELDLAEAYRIQAILQYNERRRAEVTEKNPAKADRLSKQEKETKIKREQLLDRLLTRQPGDISALRARVAGSEGYDVATAAAYRRLLAHPSCTPGDRQSYLHYLLNNGKKVDIVGISDSVLSGYCWGQRGGCEDVALDAAQMLLLSGDSATARVLAKRAEGRAHEPKVRERARKLLGNLPGGR